MESVERGAPRCCSRTEWRELQRSEPLLGETLRGITLQGEPLRGIPLQGEPLRGVPLRGVPPLGEKLPVRTANAYRAIEAVGGAGSPPPNLGARPLRPWALRVYPSKLPGGRSIPG